MRFDKTRKKSQPRQIDHFGICRRWNRTARSNSFDLLIPNQNDPPVVKLCRVAIENVRRFKKIEDVSRRAHWRLVLSKQDSDCEDNKQEKRQTHESAFLVSDKISRRTRTA